VSCKLKLSYDLVCVDLESNGPFGKIIEIGAQCISRKGILLGQYQQFVKTGESVLKEITELTSITNEEIDKNGIEFPVMMQNFEGWIQKELGTKNFLLASWGSGDSVALRQSCEEHKINYPFRGKSLDVKSIVVWMSYLCDKGGNKESLEGMLEAWCMKFVGHPHSALCDATNTAYILKAVWDYYDTRNEILLTTLRELGLAK
jgi:inhibitor of KinA sporulation pathway (predicted exonuclease)